jgi:hypothetical protein
MIARLAAVFGLVLAVGLPCRAGLLDSKPAFQIAESTVQVPDDGLGPNDVFWLDDRKLVFAGADNGEDPSFWHRPKTDEVLFPKDKARLYLWRLGEAPQVYARAAWPKRGTNLSNNYLCAGNGQITWSTDGFTPPERGSKAIPPAAVMMGALGRETLSKFSFYDDPARYPREYRAWDLDIVSRSCTQVAAPQLYDGVWVPSRSARFALDFGPRMGDGQAPLSVVALADGKRVPVRGVDARAVSPGCTHPLPWEDTILTWGCPVTWKMHPDVVPVWKVRADGSSERINMHTANLVLDYLVPYKHGFFLWSDGSRTDPNHIAIADAGLYLVKKDGLTRVLSGSAWVPRAISPNGCLAAFARSTALAGIMFRQHLVILDLCKAAEGMQ